MAFKFLPPILLLSAISSISISASDDWSYSGSNGPDNWSGTCSSGEMQSPINIEGTDPAVMYRLETNYLVTPLKMVNNRHTISVGYEPGSELAIGNKVYQLEEFHFHTPAEHTVMGKSFPMAIHFKHSASDGSLAVIAVLVQEGDTNIAATELWPYLPLEPDQSANLPTVKFNARDLMPTDKSYYRYIGSLTNPPCTEGINWYVLRTPLSFSKEQIETISGIIGTSNRPTQPRNNRIILDAIPQ